MVSHVPNKVGIGLRTALADAFLEKKPDAVSWLEIHPENYIERGGRFDWMLHKAREHYPIATHGLTLNFGNSQPFDPRFMEALGTFLEKVDSPWHSDHLCFGAGGGHFAHDLLPIAFDDEMHNIVCERITEAQRALPVPVAVENISYYAPQSDNPLDEARFIAGVVKETNCKMLLDINNVYVNSMNHNFDAKTFLNILPRGHVVQYHVAGHRLRPDGLRIDNHGETICDPVLELVPWVLEEFGLHPLLLERDVNIPALDELLKEVEILNAIVKQAEEAARRQGASAQQVHA